jgi:hypothetical protein
LAGDYNGDGRTDIAFPSPGMTSLPTLFANANGGWSYSRNSVPRSVFPSYDAVPLTGDYNGDGRTDIAFPRPGMNSLPTLRANGNGTWLYANSSVPSSTFQTGTVPLTGDYNGDGRTDIAFPKAGMSSLTTLFANSNGTWSYANHSVPSSAFQTGARPLTGDYNGDGRTDIAFPKPGMSSLPMLFANGNGTWAYANHSVPSSAYESGIVPLTGDFNGDGRTDITFVWQMAFGY